MQPVRILTHDTHSYSYAKMSRERGLSSAHLPLLPDSSPLSFEQEALLFEAAHHTVHYRLYLLAGQRLFL